MMGMVVSSVRDWWRGGVPCPPSYSVYAPRERADLGTDEEIAAQLVDAARIGCAGRSDEAVKLIAAYTNARMIPMGAGLLAMKTLLES